MAGYRVVQAEALVPFTAQVFEGLGAPADIAQQVAEHLVTANLSGHDSHGVMRIPQYSGWIDHGFIKPAARPEVVQEHGATLLVDANYGFGQPACNFTLERTIARARDTGVAAASVRHSNHIGRLGEYGERAAAAGCIAIVTVGAAGQKIGSAAPYGGTMRFLGTNPWCIGIPRTGADGQPQMPYLTDFATTVLAEGKVRVARDKHAELPPAVVLDKEGRPSTHPEDFYAGGTLLPVGNHKGYGLSLAAALLGGLGAIGEEDPSMSGAAWPPDWPSQRERTGGVFMVVVDVSAFGDAQEYATTVGRVAGAAKRVPPAPGAQEVLIPGEPEERTRVERRRTGVALPEDTWEAIGEIAGKAGVTMPAAEQTEG